MIMRRPISRPPVTLSIAILNVPFVEASADFCLLSLLRNRINSHRLIDGVKEEKSINDHTITMFQIT